MGETGKSRRAERSAPGPGFASGVSPSMRSTLDADLLRDLLCRSTWVFVRVVTKIGQSPKRQDGTVLATYTTINDGVSPFCSVSTPVRMNRFRRDLRCSKRKLNPTATPRYGLFFLFIISELARRYDKSHTQNGRAFGVYNNSVQTSLQVGSSRSIVRRIGGLRSLGVSAIDHISLPLHRRPLLDLVLLRPSPREAMVLPPLGAAVGDC